MTAYLILVVVVGPAVGGNCAQLSSATRNIRCYFKRRRSVIALVYTFEIGSPMQKS